MMKSGITYVRLAPLLAIVVLLVSGQAPTVGSNPRLGEPSATVAEGIIAMSQSGGRRSTPVALGDYLYVGIGTSLHILDISQPASPVAVGQLLMPDAVQKIAVAGKTAYLVVGQYDSFLHVVDVSEATAPRQLGSFSAPWWDFARQIAVQDRYVYVAAGSDGLRVVDVGDPKRPHEVGHSPDFAGGVSVVGDFAYLTTQSGTLLQVMDISNPPAPIEVGSFSVGGITAQFVFAVGDVAYLVSGDRRTDTLWAVNVSDPAAPYFLGSYTTDWIAGLTIGGNYAYLPIWSAQARVEIVDVSNPAYMSRINSIGTGSSTRHLALGKNNLYLLTDGVQVVNIANPFAPLVVGHYDFLAERTEDVAVAGSIAYVADRYDGLQVVDVSDPSLPHVISAYSTEDYSTFTHVALDGLVAVTVDGQINGLRLIDVSDLTAPKEVGTYLLPGQVMDLAVANGLVYVADGIFGLRLIDISDPTSPVEVGFYPVPDTTVDDVAVVGDYAYLAAGGLRVLDVSDTSRPQEVGYLPGEGVAVAADGDRVCLAGQEFWLIDVADPTLPIALGTVGMQYPVTDLVMADGLAYAAVDSNGLRVVAVGETTTPIELGYFDPPDYLGGSKLATANGNVFLASGSLGMYVLEYVPPRSYLPLVVRQRGVDLSATSEILPPP